MSEFRAVLLTDAVDSTRIAEAIGDAAMAVHWAAHNGVTRDLLRTWHGRETKEPTACWRCSTLPRKLQASQLNLPFKAQAGLHVGPLSVQENAAADIVVGSRRVEVGGLALHITARVMAVAVGGQTLLSADARNAVGDSKLRAQSLG